MPANAVVAQSGGPTSVINNSIRGAIETLVGAGVPKVYGAEMGILGILRNRLIDITAQQSESVERLSSTPSAGAIGSCRYKLGGKSGIFEEDYARIIEVFKAHGIGYFFYAGGNDSMDTANRVSQLAGQEGLELRAVGIAKTVDNDVGGPLQPDGTFAVCDHDPGYGSVARSWAVNVLEANEENKASYTSDPVLVMQAMGRKIGFITASARLADPQRKMPLLVIMPEALSKEDHQANLDFITANVNRVLGGAGRCMVVLTEGANLGDVGVLYDSFGHAQFSASERTAAQILMNYLNGTDRRDGSGRAESRLAAPGIARVDVPGTRQRREYLTVSSTDLQESYEVGANAARLALAGKTGLMSTIRRLPGERYAVEYDSVPLDVVANAERRFPSEWICGSKVDVTDGYVKWAAPLIGDPLPQFASFEPVYAEAEGLGEYTPQGLREQ